jgi:hypothetical protein
MNATTGQADGGAVAKASAVVEDFRRSRSEPDKAVAVAAISALVNVVRVVVFLVVCCVESLQCADQEEHFDDNDGLAKGEPSKQDSQTHTR